MFGQLRWSDTDYFTSHMQRCYPFYRTLMCLAELTGELAQFLAVRVIFSHRRGVGWLLRRMAVPVPGSTQADIVLKAVDSQQKMAHMQSDGVGSHPAEDYGSLARMSLITLRRRLAVQPELHRLAWAGRPDQQDV